MSSILVCLIIEIQNNFYGKKNISSHYSKQDRVRITICRKHDTSKKQETYSKQNPRFCFQNQDFPLKKLHMQISRPRSANPHATDGK